MGEGLILSLCMLQKSALPCMLVYINNPSTLEAEGEEANLGYKLGQFLQNLKKQKQKQKIMLNMCIIIPFYLHINLKIVFDIK